MPYRPQKSTTISTPPRRRVPGCVKLLGADALDFMRDQMILSTMEDKRARHLDTVEEGEETVTASIGYPTRYDKANYMAHIFCVDNFANPEDNGWIIHLWHTRLVMGKHKSYKQYMAQMSESLGVDLWKTSI
jgi:hypothetical protein